MGCPSAKGKDLNNRGSLPENESILPHFKILSEVLSDIVHA